MHSSNMLNSTKVYWGIILKILSNKVKIHSTPSSVKDLDLFQYVKHWNILNKINDISCLPSKEFLIS